LRNGPLQTGKKNKHLSLSLTLYLYRHGEKKLNIIPYFLIAQLHAIAQLFFHAALIFFETFNGFILMVAFAYWVVPLGSMALSSRMMVISWPGDRLP
jgi:hypothetical protein